MHAYVQHLQYCTAHAFNTRCVMWYIVCVWEEHYSTFRAKAALAGALAKSIVQVPVVTCTAEPLQQIQCTAADSNIINHIQLWCICRSDSNGEDLEGYAGAGLYESITMDETQLVRVDYNDDPITNNPEFRKKVSPECYWLHSAGARPTIIQVEVALHLSWCRWPCWQLLLRYWHHAKLSAAVVLTLEP